MRERVLNSAGFPLTRAFVAPAGAEQSGENRLRSVPFSDGVLTRLSFDPL